VRASLGDKQDRFSRWVRDLIERRGYWRTAVSIAAKNAHLASATLKYGEAFKHEPATASPNTMPDGLAAQSTTATMSG
jgi:transposase